MVQLSVMFGTALRESRKYQFISTNLNSLRWIIANLRIVARAGWPSMAATSRSHCVGRAKRQARHSIALSSVECRQSCRLPSALRVPVVIELGVIDGVFRIVDLTQLCRPRG